MIERPRRALRQPGGAHAARIGMGARRPKRQQGLAIERERLRDRIGAIRRIDDIPDDLQAVRVLDRTAAPGAEVFPLAIEDDHRRILALEDINAVLRVRRHPANQSEPLTVRHFEEVADQLIGMSARANSCHRGLPLQKNGSGTAFASRRSQCLPSYHAGPVRVIASAASQLKVEQLMAVYACMPSRCRFVRTR